MNILKHLICLGFSFLSVGFVMGEYVPQASMLLLLDQKIETLHESIQLRGEPFREKVLLVLDQIEDSANEKKWYSMDPEKFDFVMGYLRIAVQDFEYRMLTVDDFETDNPFAVVQMKDQILITVINDGPLGQSDDDAFEYLSSYIFGNNDAGAEIAMTSPVTRTQIDQSTYETAFIVPDGWTMETLPKPNTQRIRIKKQPGALMAVRRFSGYVTSSGIDQQRNAFKKSLDVSGVVRYGRPVLSQYDGPWVSGRNRRNELWVHLNPIKQYGLFSFFPY